MSGMNWRDLPDKALSVRQPWAWGLVKGIKPVENRTWKESNPALRFARRYRGRIFIHASKAMTRADLMDFQNIAALAVGADCPPEIKTATADILQFGGIIGMATIADVVTADSSKWFVGPIGIVLSNPVALPFTPMPGALGFFDVPEKVRRQIAGPVEARL